jgi:hypothetical protein
MHQLLFSLIEYSIKVILNHTPPNTPPPDFFSNPVWLFFSGIGGIAAVIAIPVTILVAIYINRKQRREAEAEKAVKRLVYEVISDAPIANINKAVADRVKILFDEQPVQDLYLLIFQISNGGNIAIKPDDYAEPLQLIFKGNRIYSCEILEMEPNNLIAEKDLKSFLTLNAESVTFSTILLNPNESISIKVLLAGSKRNIDIRARIADGQLVSLKEVRMKHIQIEELKYRRYRILIRFQRIVLIVILSFFIVIALLSLISFLLRLIH